MNSKNVIYILLAFAITFMIYNVISTAKEGYEGCGCGCDKEYFSDYLGNKDNTGYFDQNVKKCPHGMISYALPGVLTKQRDCSI